MLLKYCEYTYIDTILRLPVDDQETLFETQEKGFMTFENFSKIKKYFTHLIHEDLNFFSSMIPKKELGNIITIASQEENDIKKAETFLSIIRKNNEKQHGN